MNDEGYLSGKEEMERLHVDSNIDLGLGFEEKLVTLKARAGDAKMDGEGKKKGGANKKTKLVQVKVESEDDEPIGSLFKSKKLRNPKRVKSEGGKTEKVKKVRAEKMEVKEDDLGEMDDTLASFRKKLKGPKLGKDGGSGTGKGKGLGLVTNQVEESPSCSGDGSALLLDLGSADVLKCRGKKLKGAKIGKDGGSGTNDKAKGSALVSKQVEEVPTCSGDGFPLVPELGMVDTAKRWGKSLKGSKLRKDGGSGTGKGKDSVLSMAESQLKQEEGSVTCSDGGLNLQFDVRSVDVPKRQRKRSGIATTLKKAGDHSEFGDVLDQRSGDRGSQEISVKKEKEKVPTVGESCNHSSDENLEFSLSEFIRKSHSGSVKKARSSSSRKKRKVTPDSGDGLGGISDGVSKDVLPTRESHSTSVLSSEFPSTDGGSNLASGRSSTDLELVKETVETQGLYERPSQSSCWTQEGKVAGPVQELARLPEFAENIGRSIGDGCNKSLEEVSRVSSSSLIQSGPRSVTDFIANSAVPNDDECNRCDKSPEGISGDPVPISELPSSHSGFVTNMSEKPVAPTIDEFDRIKIFEETPENLGSSDYHCDAASREFLSRQVHTSCHGAAPKFVGETESFKSRLKPCSNGEENAVSADDELNRLPRQTSENLLSSVGLISSDVNMNSADVLGDRSGLCGGCPSNAIEEPSASFIMPNNETVPCVDDDQVGIKSKRKCSDDCLKNGDRISQPCENTFPELSGEKLTSVACKSEAEDIAGDDEVAQPFRIKLGDCLMHTMQDSASVSDPLKMAESPRLQGFVQFSDRCLQNSKLQQLSSAAGPLLKKYETVAEDEDSYQTLGTFLEESRLATAPKRAGEIARSDGRPHLVLEPDDAVKSSDFCSPINQEGELVAPDDVSNHFSDGSLQVFSASPQYKPSDDGEGSPSPCQDKQEIMVACSQSIELEPRETLPDDSGKEFEPENKDGKLLPMQRAVREVKKRRHEDMAYEGDTDWDFLVHGQGIFENSRVVDEDRPPRVKNKLNFLLTMGLEADDISTAAVASGLKARAAGPFEKIRFKDILKRRGGLQEYLECRNLILGLWSKDTSRILPLSDCGVTDTVCKDESSRVSLIREIYAFLNRNGYINAGIAYEKEKADLDAKATCGLSKGTIKESFGAQVADSEDGAAFIFSQAKSSEKLTEVKANMLSTTDKSLSEATNIQKHLVTSTGSESSALLESEECVVISDRENGWIDTKLPNRTANLDALTNPSSEVADDGQDTLSGLEPIKDSYGIQSSEVDPVEEKDSGECDLKVQRKIIVIGAGPAGLTAARHLQRQGFSVTVLEARNRLGGRVYTDRSSLSVPVDLGASIITGVEADIATERRPDPSSLICSQLGLELTVLNSDCPLYDTVTGEKVPAELDEALEAEYNSLLDDTVVLVQQKGERAVRLSLEDGLEYALKKRRMSQLMSDAEKFDLDASVLASFDTGANGLNRKLPNSSKEEILSPLERRVMNWHFANLEYGCAALLKEVSLPHWNQDDVYGGFGGAHCMIKGGYSTVIDSLGKGLHIYLNHVVTEVSYSMKGSGGTDEQLRKVKVSTSNGSEFLGDAVLVTVPLGCLKANTITFSPSLPEWKESSIRQLGFGVLNKVVLQFPEVFWDDSVDYFGATAKETDRRGQCFMFWNVKKTVGAPVLIALVVGKAALDGQSMMSSDHVNHAVKVLRKLFGEASVPDPVASVVTNWGQDPFSRGAYSYVAVGASGEDYDILGRPVENCLFFAGEATCKEHPDTVGGAMMSGLREAVRIIDILNTGHDHTAEVEAMEAAQRQSESERNEVRDILKRLEAIELSNVLSKSSLDGDRMLTKEALLQDMFHNAKTTAGRLHLAKKLLNLPVEALKSFAGTKEGLSTLNSWILDSMGKDGTQLLRHCVRLLVLVSTNLIAVRLSGIGKTVKEKVCVHTSRDIRAVASQLVSVWIEVFRKEKAANGGLKLLRQTSASASLKAKSSKDLISGKLLRTNQNASYNRGNMHIPSPPRKNSPTNTDHKKMNCKPVKIEITDSKADVRQWQSQGVVETLDSKVEDNNVLMSEEEAAAFAAAEAARAAALAAAEAYASKEAECSSLRDLPKIPSFHKFARREQYAQMDDSELRKKWSGGVSGRQDCLSDIDSRNCKVRNWSVDFSAACANLDSSRMSGDNYTQQSYSNEVMYQANLREHSGESVATDCRLTKAWVDSAGSGGVKDYHAIERWQSQAAAADSDFYHSTLHIRDEEDSNTASKPLTRKYDKRTDGSAASQAAENQVVENQSRGVEKIKKAVVDYVGSLLMPLYKARKIDKDGYKSIMKKSATKVMELTTDAEKLMTASEFLDFKRKNKIRAFVDKLIEKHMAMTPVDKP